MENKKEMILSDKNGKIKIEEEEGESQSVIGRFEKI
jgi:hypothetical protein